MILKKQTLALAISVALVGSLTACSGGSNQSSPVVAASAVNALQPQTSTTAQVVSEEPAKAVEQPASVTSMPSIEPSHSAVQPGLSPQPKTEETASVSETAAFDRAKHETQLDPNGKILWRSVTGLVPSSDAWPNNPLRAESNGKISPQVGAAAFANGPSDYKDGNELKDFRNPAHRATTNYDPNFMTKADIDPARLQTLNITNQRGESVANIHFVNQLYSSYSSWKSAEIPMVSGYPVDSRMSGYVAVPTKSDADLRSKGKATYQGHTIVQKAPNSSEVHFGNIRLEADFDSMKISGKLTNRNDMLLDASVKYHSEILDNFTATPEDLEDYPEMTLISEQALAEKIEAEKQQYRTVDVTINEANIKAENGVVAFYKGVNALSYTHESGEVKTGAFGGIFAGDRAQEAVGEIQGGETFLSFGASEVTK